MSGPASLEYAEPARSIPVATSSDVLVVGGGAAGIAAATAAAREGADTVLLERYGSLGGMATGGLIILLLTLDDGCGNVAVAGLCEEIVQRLNARGAAYHPPRHELGASDERVVDHYRRWGLVWGRPPHAVRYSVAYCPEELRFVANDMLVEAGVRMLFHSWVAAPIVEDGRVTGVITESKAGRRAHRASVVIDASGDGDVFAAAGQEFDMRPVTPWLWFRMGNVAAPDEAIEHGKGKFFTTLGGRFFRTIGEGRTLMPWGISDVVDRRIDATSPEDLTFAEVECRRRVMEVVDRLRAEEPAFADAYLTDIAWQLGIYESRRLRGRYVLGADDAGVAFEDAIAFTGHWVQNGTTFEIPYRCLLPPVLEGLLAPYSLHLAVAPTKMNDRYEWFLEKATEIGITQITPIICDHSERTVFKADRFEKIIQSAMKQSLQYYMPKLNEPVAFNSFVKEPHKGLLFIAHCEETEKRLLKNAVEPKKEVTILIGPEGDFSTKEITLALQQNYIPVSLGNTRLRTETAAVVAAHSVAFVNEE